MDDSIDDCNRDVGNESRIHQQRGNSGEVLCNFLTIPSGGGNARRASSGTVIRWLDAEACNANCSGGNVSIPIHPPTVPVLACAARMPVASALDFEL